MKIPCIAAALFVLSVTSAYAADGFEAVRCGGDIPKALIGKRGANETVVVIEGRHKDLGLQDLGADEINDNLSAISWRICGKEYVVIEDQRGVVRDAIEFPSHSFTRPQFDDVGCKLRGKELPDLFAGILDNHAGAKPSDPPSFLPVLAAWRVDEKHGKFVAQPTAGLTCPRTGIFTVDDH